jgi:5-bromo-4-chloroindolyl phosphate hydrolysis protein
MVTVKVTRSQYRILQNLTRKEVGTLKKYPKVLAEARQLMRACKKVIKKLGEIPEHANRRKRQTAYKRISNICQKALDRIEK